MNPALKALYGLKFNPFTPDLPLEALHLSARLENFAWRIEHGLAHEGGFALIAGEPGTGKSVALRVLAERLGRLREVNVGCLEHPQSNLADFYREMGDLFAVTLKPHNRWAGFRVLRERWLAHIDATLIRPILLIDEAQEMQPGVLNELRILTSTRFDSRAILSVVLAGDRRLLEKLRREELLPLGSRIRMRLLLEPASSEELRACLTHLVETAGNAKLMTRELIETLCDHALGNYRTLCTLANELLNVAAHRQLEVLDEKLYLEVFAAPNTPRVTPPRAARARR
jgi:type II secretory pathway predicted ATPase ExeA